MRVRRRTGYSIISTFDNITCVFSSLVKSFEKYLEHFIVTILLLNILYDNILYDI